MYAWQTQLTAPFAWLIFVHSLGIVQMKDSINITSSISVYNSPRPTLKKSMLYKDRPFCAPNVKINDNVALQAFVNKYTTRRTGFREG